MAINFPTSPSVNDIHTSGDMSWKWDGTTWKATIVTSIPIPSQSGQAGEYLQTDGTTMSWEAVDALPTQTGQAGEFLQTDGTTATWEPVVSGGNPTTVSDQANTSTGYFDIPSGTDAQRPGSPGTGMLRYNSDQTQLEHYADGGWIGFAGSTPTITGVSPLIAPAAGTAITVLGINFQAGTTVKLIGTDATQYNALSVTFVSSTEIQFATPELPVTKEPYDVQLTLPNGGVAISADILDAGGVPTWTTAAGSLGSIGETATGTHFTLVATDPDSQAVTYTETTSVLTTAGLTLNSTTGAITGDPTDQPVGGSTTYNFDVFATDSTGVNVSSTRTFSITVDGVWSGASGGTITSHTSGATNYKIHAFTGNGTFSAGSMGGTADVLAVGGGGSAGWASGGWWGGGGGGAGGLVMKPSHTFAANETAAITIGQGGTGVTSIPGSDVELRDADEGTDTIVGTLLTAKGGGGGNNDGGWASNMCHGGSGGGGTWSSGGGTANQTSQAGDSGTYGFGNNGGSGSGGTVGGGGGGASSAGHTGGQEYNGGNGKDYSAEFGTTYGDTGWFAGGGGGGCYNTNQPTTGGQGGGGAGVGQNTGPGNPGTANTGGGGGCGYDAVTGSGGSGIVLIRYEVA